jgi:hypothetical protein
MVIVLSVLLAASPAVEVKAGALTLELHRSELAQWFHVTDQLSQWNPYTHRQFRDLLLTDAGSSEAEAQALAAHAALRRRLGYGVLERAFYAERSLDEALAWLSTEGALAPADVEVERAVMNSTRARVLPFVHANQPRLAQWSEGVTQAKAELQAFEVKASHFFGCGPSTLPVFGIPSPSRDRSGGGTNGGVLTIEVSEGQPPLDIVLHEAWHALSECKKPALRTAATELGTDFETLSEGLAYAASPGLWRMKNPQRDVLVETVRGDLLASKPFEQAYVRFNRLALALRPSLRQALEQGVRFDEYLATERLLFSSLAELALAEERATPGFFCFGAESACAPLTRAMAAKGVDAWSRALAAPQVASLRQKMKPFDRVVLVSPSSPPDELRALCADELTLPTFAHPADGGISELPCAAARVTVGWGPDAAARVKAALGL